MPKPLRVKSKIGSPKLDSGLAGVRTITGHIFQAAVCAIVIATVSGYPSPQGPEGPLPIPREGSYGPDQYFQYINVPAHKTFEWGYKRGDPKHNREEYLSQKDHTFKAKVKLQKLEIKVIS